MVCFDHICNHPHGQENHTQKYINMVLITFFYFHYKINLIWSIVQLGLIFRI